MSIPDPDVRIRVSAIDVLVFDSDRWDLDAADALLERLREVFPENVILFVPGGKDGISVLAPEQAAEALNMIAEAL